MTVKMTVGRGCVKKTCFASAQSNFFFHFWHCFRIFSDETSMSDDLSCYAKNKPKAVVSFLNLFSRWTIHWSRRIRIIGKKRRLPGYVSVSWKNYLMGSWLLKFCRLLSTFNHGIFFFRFRIFIEQWNKVTDILSHSCVISTIKV